MAGVGDRARIYCSHPRWQNWLCGGTGVSAYPHLQPQAHTFAHTDTLHGAVMSHTDRHRHLLLPQALRHAQTGSGVHRPPCLHTAAHVH